MNRPAIITLRVLAIGSALTAITCQVANRQKLANQVVAAGDRGASGPAAPPATSRPTWAPSSKSIDSLIVPTRPPITGVPSAPATVPDPPEQAVTPAVKEEVQRLFRRGLGFYDLGHFKEAEVEFKSILVIDPQNAAAARALERARNETSPQPVAPPVNAAPSTSPPPVRSAAPRYFPGSKSAAVVSPADVRQMQQRVDPRYHQAPAQQSANRQQ